MTIPADGPIVTTGGPTTISTTTTVVSSSTSVDDTIVPTLPGQGEVIWQTPHAPYALHLPLRRGKKLKRGYIIQDKSDPAVKANKHGRALGLSFLYNPTEVNVNYQLATSLFPSGNNTAPGSDIKLVGVPGAATVSWNLIFDRTYEVQDPSSNGILDDVHQFEKMMAYTEESPFIQPVAMFVVFGSTKMKYYGYINTFGVVYTNWTQNMVPYRGGVTGIEMQVLPLASGSKSKAHIYDVTNSRGGVKGGSTGKPGKTGDGTGKSNGTSTANTPPRGLDSMEIQDIASGTVIYSDAAGKNLIGTVSSVTTDNVNHSYAFVIFSSGSKHVYLKTLLVFVGRSS